MGEKDYSLKVGPLQMLMHMALITRWNPSLETNAGSAFHEAAPQPGICWATGTLCAALGWAGRGWALRAGVWNLPRIGSGAHSKDSGKTVT